MGKAVIRLFAFFFKEFNEISRQPRLILSLIFGPFLILLLFGIGYQGERPALRTALVVPPEMLADPRLDQVKRSIELNFTLASTDSNREGAMQLLRNGAIDVVEVLPPDLEARVLRTERVPVEFYYNEINPLNEQWIQYLGYAQISELNRTILLESTSRLQDEARNTKALLAESRTQLEALDTGLSTANSERARQTLRRLSDATQALALSPLFVSQLGEQGADPAQTQQQLLTLREDLERIDQAIGSGTLAQQQERIRSARERIAQLEEAADRIGKLPPEAIVSPLEQRFQNLYGTVPDFMTFYAPGVLALILQHIAVTLGALSLVRERLLGAIEFYGVAPVRLIQVVVGKYLGYTVFIGLITACLVALLFFGLRVPFLGSVLLFVEVSAVFILASLGVGFLISALSTSDSQAVQLSMLVLLLSIFFSGFFLALENFWEPVRAFGYLLPLTHGISGFQSIMLRGAGPGLFSWVMLSSIAAVTFLLVLLIWRAQFRSIA